MRYFSPKAMLFFLKVMKLIGAVNGNVANDFAMCDLRRWGCHDVDSRSVELVALYVHICMRMSPRDGSF